MSKFDLNLLIRDLNEVLGIDITIHDNTGLLREYFAGSVSDFHNHRHEYCCHGRWSRADYDRNCLRECQVNMDNRQVSEVFLHHCWKGACEIVFPVTIDNCRVMTVFAGVFRHSGSICPPELQEQWEKLPVLSEEKLRKIINILSVAIDSIIRRTKKSLSGSTLTGRAGVIMNYLRMNYDKNIGLADIASLLSVSPSRAGHIVKAVLGKSLKKIILGLRLRRAEELLAETEYTIEHIAVMTGLGNAGYLHRIFSRERGVTPGEFRKKSQKIWGG